MLKLIVLSSLLTQTLCYASDNLLQPRLSAQAPAHFPWESFQANTGVDEKQYLSPPAKGVPVTYTCTKKPGPEPNFCSDAFTAWDKQADSQDMIHVDAGQCAAITQGTCEVVVCAPLGALSIKVDEVVGRMWNPMLIKCIMGGASAIYQSQDSTFVIGIARPVG
ncbi:hypothetical protein BGZ63DRAFT_386088 [Mariannaea sp. PMI_226]|nr:hypothetical protein BGZ63DRAFT_386088 [Mariannaea sp. PMI_226]